MEVRGSPKRPWALCLTPEDKWRAVRNFRKEILEKITHTHDFTQKRTNGVCGVLSITM